MCFRLAFERCFPLLWRTLLLFRLIIKSSAQRMRCQHIQVSRTARSTRRPSLDQWNGWENSLQNYAGYLFARSPLDPLSTSVSKINVVCRRGSVSLNDISNSFLRKWIIYKVEFSRSAGTSRWMPPRKDQRTIRNGINSTVLCVDWESPLCFFLFFLRPPNRNWLALCNIMLRSNQ